MKNLTSIVLALALAVGGAACGDNDDENVDRDAEVATARAAGEALGATHAATLRTDLASAEEAMRVGVSAKILMTIDEGEILVAEAALVDCSDDDACDYAEEMIEVHSAHMTQVQSMLDATQATAVDHPVAAMLRAEAMAEASKVSSAAEVDAAYLRSQVMMHAEALLIVTELESQVTEPAAADLMTTTRETIAEHREHAEHNLRDL